jgi:hypothetical protein
LTLVAAYRSAGVPVLLGDFLISRRDDRGRGKKKISRIRRNLVVGWTGNLLQAENVLGLLFEDIGDKPTKESIEAWFSQLEVERPPEPNLKLAGWISEDGGEFGFHWDAGVGQVTWGEEWFIGSGGRAFEASFTGYRSPLDPEIGPQVKAALETLIGVLTQLNCTDRIAQEGQAEGIGGGYEALYWSAENRAFEYLGDALYFIVVSRLDAQGVLKSEPELLGDSLTTYRARIAGEYSVLTFSEGEGHDIWVMTAAGQPCSRNEIHRWLQSELAQPMDLHADYYGGLLMFAAPAPCPPVPWVGCPWDSWSPFSGGRGQFELRIPRGAIEEIYQERQAVYAASPYPLGVIPPDGRR